MPHSVICSPVKDVVSSFWPVIGTIFLMRTLYRFRGKLTGVSGCELFFQKSRVPMAFTGAQRTKLKSGERDVFGSIHNECWGMSLAQ